MRRKYTPSFIAKVSFEVIEDSSSVITIVPFRRKATGGSSLCRTTRFKGYEDMDKSIKKPQGGIVTQFFKKLTR